MSNTPKVSIAFSNDNLLQNIASIDGEVALIGTGATLGNLNKVFVINSLADAISQGITLVGEPVAYRHIKEFYQELGGNQELFVLLLPDTVTMAQMLDSTATDKATKLIAAGAGKIAYLGVFKTPHAGYDAGADFLDSDVAAAVTAAKPLVQSLNNSLNFLRVLIEGRINDETSNTIYTPNTASNGFAGVVLGGTQNDKSASIGLLLGRKVKYAAHIKIGKVANGPLTANGIYIGTKALKDVANLDALHGKGFISFVTYPGKAGFYFGIDNMASADDYSILAHGAVVDAAAKIAALVYTEDLEGEVDTNADGTITELDAKHLEDRIEQQVNVSLGDRISGFAALVDRTSNIINTNKTSVKLRVRPKGYNTFIDVDLGLTAGN
jgi:hypothetical protein